MGQRILPMTFGQSLPPGYGAIHVLAPRKRAGASAGIRLVGMAALASVGLVLLVVAGHVIAAFA